MIGNVTELSSTTDAHVWAEEWIKVTTKHPSIPTDKAAMIGWFANAIMAGYDFAKKEDTYGKQNRHR